MNLTFLTVQPRLFGIELPTFDVSNESGSLRQTIERFLRGGKKKAATFEKLPNTYVWHYVEDEICVARGSSGAIALWVSEKSK
jgi:hypothetical protein